METAMHSGVENIPLVLGAMVYCHWGTSNQETKRLTPKPATHVGRWTYSDRGGNS